MNTSEFLVPYDNNNTL